jgi:hypothetical protein
MKLYFNFRKIFFTTVAVLLFTCQGIQAQDDATWWNETHHWDGITSWTQYIIYSTSYMGPNALPVPFSPKGLIREEFEFKMDAEYHYYRGDKTQDIFLDCYIPVVKDKIALEFYGVPFEHYDMDKPTVIERRARNQSGEGFASGDFYFSTLIQVIKNKRMPDIAVRLACKTAPGSKLSDARNTDAPGYFFDLSLGKDLLFSGKNLQKLRFHGMLGFYSWQMNLPENRQNDAFLFGVGMDLSFRSFYINNAVDGYLGYFGKEQVIVGDKEDPVPFNDRPVVYRLDIMKKTNHIDFGLGCQLALNDFPYQSFKISGIYHLPFH